MFLSAQPTGTSRELNSDGGGHWYHTDGRPQHTVISASTGKSRNTTLRDARKMGLLPSVTTVTKVVSNPSLERWKQNQLLEAAYNNISHAFKEDGKNLFRLSTLKDSQKKMVDARAFGSEFHGIVESLSRDGAYDEEGHEGIADYINEFVDWSGDVNIKPCRTEFTAVNSKLGYAGQVDSLARVDGKMALIDYKTQNIRPKGDQAPTLDDVNVYQSWGEQLAAYWHADWGEGKPKRRPLVLSVIINSCEPSYPIVKEWSTSELAYCWKRFKASLALWKLVNNYDPVKKGK